MARAVSTRRRVFFTALAWSIAFVIFFPILWTFLTSFKSEGDAAAIPPQFLFFDWTTENYAVVQERSNYFKFAMNSVYPGAGLHALRAGDRHSRPPGPWPSRPASTPRTS